MRKAVIFICMLIVMLTTGTSCTNGAVEKYESQKTFVDSLQKANEKTINGAILSGSSADVLKVKLECYHNETVALDSLKNLAKEAFGDNSSEYKEAYDKMIKAQTSEDEATKGALNSLSGFINGN